MARNWRWAVPVGCLSPILVCGGFFTILIAVVFGAIRSSDVYKDAVAQARSNPAVIAALGTPVETGIFMSGKINVQNSSGDADISIPIHGSKGAGTIHAVATKTAGKWGFSELVVHVDETGQRVDLLKAEK
jgi:hypothetical protein